jgi:hypothetical protein
MSEALKIALTAFFGVCVFVIGQVISKFLIEPVYEHRKTIGNVAHALIYNAGWISNPGDVDPNGERTKASDFLRQLSCDLMAKTRAIPCYRLFALLMVVPKSGAIFESHRHLIFLSNSLFRGHSRDNQEAVKQIKELLKMRF